ncbi:MAG: sigma-70 family RNA polymerase sigma factor [Bacteroidota bacterium]
MHPDFEWIWTENLLAHCTLLPLRLSFTQDMHKAVSETDQRIISLLSQRDQQAIRLIYEQYARTLLGVLLRILGDQALAEDCLQEALVKVWKNADRYDPKKGRLFTWLLNICRNTAIDKRRSAAFKQQQSIQQNESLVSMVDRQKAYSFNPDQIGLRDWVHKLSPEQIEVIDIVYFRGFSHREAAKQLDLPLGTLKTRIRAALQQLRAWTKN